MHDRRHLWLPAELVPTWHAPVVCIQIAWPRWPLFGRPRTLNTAYYCTSVSTVSAGQQRSGQVAGARDTVYGSDDQHAGLQPQDDQASFSEAEVPPRTSSASGACRPVAADASPLPSRYAMKPMRGYPASAQADRAVLLAPGHSLARQHLTPIRRTWKPSFLPYQLSCRPYQPSCRTFHPPERWLCLPRCERNALASIL
jgi:hypothetical protein